MKQIKGLPGSTGNMTGIARVILSLDKIGKLQPGDILVTQATSPIWTPFVYTASAVVTDKGGILSHAAIICREYKIPAVVGTKNGTKQIKNGQKIGVNGSKGIVKILD